MERGVTWSLLHDLSRNLLGGGTLPVLAQATLLAASCLDRSFRVAHGFLIAAVLLPLALFCLAKPSHFLAWSYFLYAYPLTVGLVAGGLGTLCSLKSAETGVSALRSVVAALLVAAAPLLPRQHPAWSYHREDWRVIVRDIEAELADGDCIWFPRDAKSYCMVRHYAPADFFERHALVEVRRGLLPAWTAGKALWIVKQDDIPSDCAALCDGTEMMRAWHVFPKDVKLYRSTRAATGTQGQVPFGAGSGPGS
jgi:hypothetical protein